MKKKKGGVCFEEIFLYGGGGGFPTYSIDLFWFLISGNVGGGGKNFGMDIEIEPVLTLLRLR